MINTLPSKQKFDEYVRLGMVQKRFHKTLPLSIYTYTLFTNFERLWNNVTLNARGIVFDDKDRVIIRCMRKFFNEDEPHALCDKPVKTKSVYYDKLDGSLILLANDPEYGLVVASKGSFQSEHVKWATELLNTKYADVKFISGQTYVFELIHPANRIVLDYGDMKDLFLITIIDNTTGEEYDIQAEEYDVFNRVKVITDFKKHMEDKLVEGVVVKTGTHRYKIKTGEYIRLHRIVTEFTPKRVWEALRDGKSLEFPNMPEEFQDWLDDTIKDIQNAYDKIVADVEVEYERTKHLTDKELGLEPDIKHKGFVYNMRTGKDSSEYIWRLVKPKEETI